MVIEEKANMVVVIPAANIQPRETTDLAQGYDIGRKETLTFFATLVCSPLVGGMFSGVALKLAEKIFHIPAGVEMLTVVEPLAMGTAEMVGMKRWFRRQDRLQAEYTARRRNT